MPFPALLIPLLFWTAIAALSSWAVSRALPLSATRSEEIDAPAETAWELLTTLERTPEWNEHILAVTAPQGLVEGGKLRMRVRHPEAHRITATLRPTVTGLEPARQLEWSSRIIAGWLLRVTETITLQPLGADRTEITQTLAFSGVLSPGVPFLASISKLLDSSNKQFRELVEKLPERDLRS